MISDLLRVAAAPRTLCLERDLVAFDLAAGNRVVEPAALNIAAVMAPPAPSVTASTNSNPLSYCDACPTHRPVRPCEYAAAAQHSAAAPTWNNFLFKTMDLFYQLCKGRWSSRPRRPMAKCYSHREHRA